MNELKATPGPWRVRYAKFNEVCAGNGALIAECNKLDGLVNMQANAALIAAAPELYAACALDAGIEPLLIAANALRSYGNDQLAGILERKHKLEVAAIKKARGEA